MNKKKEKIMLTFNVSVVKACLGYHIVEVEISAPAFMYTIRGFWYEESQIFIPTGAMPLLISVENDRLLQEIHRAVFK